MAPTVHTERTGTVLARHGTAQGHVLRLYEDPETGKLHSEMENGCRKERAWGRGGAGAGGVGYETAPWRPRGLPA